VCTLLEKGVYGGVTCSVAKSGILRRGVRRDSKFRFLFAPFHRGDFNPAPVNDVNFEDFKFISHLGTGHTRVLVPPVLRVLVRVRTTAVQL
jgi:hypothetical protein